MVTTTTTLPLAKRLLKGIQRDVGAFFATFASLEPPTRGMYTYRVMSESEGRHIRIHLRIEDNGAGVLFVDVTDVVHLNATATEMAKLALDGVPIEHAQSALLSRYGTEDRGRIAQELLDIYAMIESFSNPGDECPTCAVSGLDRMPLFSIRARAPYKVDLAITYGCNNECPHCYNEADRLTMPSLRKEDWYRVIDTLTEIGVPHVIFTGGEATLHPDLPELIAYADQLGHVVGLNTNGRRIAHKPYIQTLADAGLNHVQVTLGSHIPEVHNAMMGAEAFRQTVRGIQNAIKSSVHVITNTTLMRCNMDHVEEIIDYLYELGIRTFAMNGMIYSGGGFSDPNSIPEEEMPPLLVRVRDHAADLGMRFLWYTPTEYCRMSPVELEIGAKRCNAGEYSMCVEPNGDILPCQSFYTSAGNILHDPWEDIWNGELFRSFRDREDDPRWAGLPEKCWECPDLPLCGGGCRILREAREGRRTGDGGGGGGGGCGGCSGGCGTGQFRSNVPSAGYIPNASVTRTTLRTSGNMQMPMIAISDINTTPASQESSVNVGLTLVNIESNGESCQSGSCGCSH